MNFETAHERAFLNVMCEASSGDSRFFGLDAEVEDFTSEPRRDIWRVVSGLAKTHETDPFADVTGTRVYSEAEKVLGRKPVDGYHNELAECLFSDRAVDEATLPHVTGYLRAMKTARRSREIGVVVTAIQEAAKENPHSLVANMDELRSRLETELVKDDTKGRLARSTLREMAANLRYGEKITPIDLGLLRGEFALGRGTLTILAGPRKAGKSLFAMNRMLWLAEQAKPCLFLSLEMTREQIDARIGGYLTGIDYRQFEYALATEQEIEALDDATSRAGWLDNLIVDCRKTHTIDTIEGTIRLWQLRRPELSLVVIDYDTLIETGTKSRSMAEGSDTLYRALASLAKRLNIAVLVLAQFRNDAVNSLYPTADDIYGGVNPAAKADAVLVIHCPEDAGLVTKSYSRHVDEMLLRVCVDIQRSGPKHPATWLVMRPWKLEIEEPIFNVRRDLESELRDARRKGKP